MEISIITFLYRRSKIPGTKAVYAACQISPVSTSYEWSTVRLRNPQIPYRIVYRLNNYTELHWSMTLLQQKAAIDRILVSL